MNLFPALESRYTKEQLSAREAQRQAEFIAWGPIVFQATRLMLKFGILEMLRDSEDGLTEAEVVEKTGLSKYAVKCLLTQHRHRPHRRGKRPLHNLQDWMVPAQRPCNKGKH